MVSITVSISNYFSSSYPFPQTYLSGTDRFSIVLYFENSHLCDILDSRPKCPSVPLRESTPDVKSAGLKHRDGSYESYLKTERHRETTRHHEPSVSSHTLPSSDRHHRSHALTSSHNAGLPSNRRLAIGAASSQHNGPSYHNNRYNMDAAPVVSPRHAGNYGYSRQPSRSIGPSPSHTVRYSYPSPSRDSNFSSRSTNLTLPSPRAVTYGAPAERRPRGSSTIAPSDSISNAPRRNYGAAAGYSGAPTPFGEPQASPYDQYQNHGRDGHWR